MFVFRINVVLNTLPIAPEDHTGQDNGEPQTWVNLSIPHNLNPVPSKGIIKVAVSHIAGQVPERAGFAWFLNGDFTCKCSVTLAQEGLECDLYFNQIFIDGFEAAIDYFHPEGKYVVGMSKAELDKWHQPDLQRELLGLLATVYFPEKYQEIKQLGVVSYGIQPSSNKHTASRFLGKPQLNAGGKIPKSKNGRQMFHLATFNITEITAVEPVHTPNWKTWLSFYVALDEIENGWTGDMVECHVLNYDDKKSGRYSDDFECEEEEFISFECKLDLPEKDHPIISRLRLNIPEQERYELLRDIWNTIQNPDEEEINKLFGYPDSIQECVASEIDQLHVDSTNPHKNSEKPENWVLLLQIFTDTEHFSLSDYLGYETYYFMIKADDLKSGNFGQVKLVLQNT